MRNKQRSATLLERGHGEPNEGSVSGRMVSEIGRQATTAESPSRTPSALQRIAHEDQVAPGDPLRIEDRRAGIEAVGKVQARAFALHRQPVINGQHAGAITRGDGKPDVHNAFWRKAILKSLVG